MVRSGSAANASERYSGETICEAKKVIFWINARARGEKEGIVKRLRLQGELGKTSWQWCSA